MAVVRFSLMRPIVGQRAAVERLVEELNQFVSKQPGFIMACRFRGRDDEEIGRLAVYETAERADEIALMDHTQAVRSQLHELIQAGHMEELFIIRGTPIGLSKAKG